MHDRLSISIAIGGKSTLMNGLFVEQYSDMKLKRTIMVPQVYQESEEKLASPEEVNIRNRTINESILQKEKSQGMLLQVVPIIPGLDIIPMVLNHSLKS